MLGTAQVHYPNHLKRSQAALERKKAALAYMNGQDVPQAVAELIHKGYDEKHLDVTGRELRRPHEVVAEPNNRGFVFLDNHRHAFYAHYKPWWEWMPPGSILDNPKYAHLVGKDRVVITHRGKQRKARVIQRDEPPEWLQDHFQYRECGVPYRFVEGFEPVKPSAKGAKK